MRVAKLISNVLNGWGINCMTVDNDSVYVPDRDVTIQVSGPAGPAWT